MTGLLLAVCAPVPAAPRVTVRASLDRTSVPLNRTATLTVKVEWRGKWGEVDLEEPSLPQSADLDIKAGAVSTETVTRRGEQVSVRLYSFELSPRRVGVAEVSPVIVTYRTPGDDKPHDLQTPRLKLEVTPAVREGLSQGARRGLRLAAVGALLALLAVACLRAWKTLRQPEPEEDEEPLSPAEQVRADLEACKALRLAGDARGYCDAAAAALRTYLGAVFDVTTRDMSTAQLLDELTARNAAPQLLDRCRVVLERCDLAKFAGTSPSPAELDELHDAIRAVASLRDRAAPVRDESTDHEEPD